MFLSHAVYHLPLEFYVFKCPKEAQNRRIYVNLVYTRAQRVYASVKAHPCGRVGLTRDRACATRRRMGDDLSGDTWCVHVGLHAFVDHTQMTAGEIWTNDEGVVEKVTIFRCHLNV